MRRDLVLLCAVVFLIRLPFLDQAVQGDDPYYLLMGSNALVDPLHPMQMGFRFQGELVWAAGHTRPPLNAYILGALSAVFGEVRETAFHLAYLTFSLLAAVSMYFLARRFSRQPFLATLLFLSVPAFVVNGNKLEADLPLLALWVTGFAFFVHGRFLLAAASLAIAGLCAYQAVFGVPILALYAWQRHRATWRAWLAVFAAPSLVTAWQLFERASTGTAPAAVLAGYFGAYNLLALDTKLQSTLALISHLGFMISPLLVALAWSAGARKGWLFLLSPYGLALLPALVLADYSTAQRLLIVVALGTGLLVLAGAARTLLQRNDDDDTFLAVWLGVFFLASVVVFYAGSARYLLPLAPALALLVVRRPRHTGVIAGLAVTHLVLGLCLARAEYEYDEQYRAFAQRLEPMRDSRRLWSNAEWGLRYYLGRLGGEPLLLGQTVHAESLVVSSELAATIPFASQGTRNAILQVEVETQRMPFRTIGLGSRSGYSSAALGILPFDFGHGLIDRLTAYSINLTEPTLPYLTMNAPENQQQLLSGFYELEDGAWRWMGERGIASLRVTEGVSQFELVFYIHDMAPARRVAVAIDGQTIADETYTETGPHTLQVPFTPPEKTSVQVLISVDKTFQPPGDERTLGVYVNAFGLK